MSKINGSALLVDINVAAPGDPDEWKTICGSTSHTLNLNQDLPDATTKCSDGKAEHIIGLQSESIDVEGLQDPTNEMDFAELYALYRARESFRVRSYLTPEAATYLVGMASIASLSQSAPQEETAGWSASFTINGGLEPNVT